MRIKFLQEAQSELDEAIDYYNSETNGLGSDFLQEVLNAIERVANILMPGILFQKTHGAVRQGVFHMALFIQGKKISY